MGRIGQILRRKLLPGNGGVFGDAKGQTRLDGLISVDRDNDYFALAGFAENVVAAVDPLQSPTGFF